MEGKYYKPDEYYRLPSQWTLVPRGDVAPHWSRLFVTLNKKGEIVLGGITHRRLGSPDAFLVKFDSLNKLLALVPATLDTENAYPARVKGGGGARVVRVHRLITEFAIRPPDTIEFMKLKIDLDGSLIMSLRDIRISPKAHSQCRRKE
jgi:hypothetical protein